jgi:hypothetical protein
VKNYNSEDCKICQRDLFVVKITREIKNKIKKELREKVKDIVNKRLRYIRI